MSESEILFALDIAIAVVLEAAGSSAAKREAIGRLVRGNLALLERVAKHDYARTKR